MPKKSLIFLFCLVILFFVIFYSKKLNEPKKYTTNKVPNLIVIPNNSAIAPVVIKNNYIPLSNTEISKIEELKNYLLGKFDHFKRDDFVLVSDKYTFPDLKIYLRKEAYLAFQKMSEEASKEEVNLKIISGLRTFNYQKSIWEGKWNGTTLANGKNLKKTITDEFERVKKILEYSAMPGTSRHHWGTEIDLNNTDAFYFDSEKGKKEYDWMVNNASRFGFCQPYNKKDEINMRTGYSEEKWHWSYLPISKELTKNYTSLITEDTIKGFLGDKYVADMNIITDYVLGINPECI